MGDQGVVSVTRVADAVVEEVVLFTQHQGRALAGQVQAALKRGIGRWRDGPYLARIVFCEMLLHAEHPFEGTEGYGIYARLTDEMSVDRPVISIATDLQEVFVMDFLPSTIRTVWRGSLDEFVVLDLATTPGFEAFRAKGAQ